MSNSFQILRYRKSDRDEVFAFLRQVYPRVDSDRLINQWDWKYDANPFNGNGEPYILLLKNGTNIIGMLGTISLRVSIHGKEHWVKNSCDFIIQPEYRGQKLSRWMVSQYAADNPMGIGWLNEISQRVSASSTTSQFVRQTFLVKLLNFSQIFYKITGNRLFSRWSDLVIAVTRPLIRPLRRRSYSAGITIAQVVNFDRSVDSLWQQVCRDYPVIVVRDQSYLNWRFVYRPDAQYTMLTATKGADLVGYLVLRLSEKAGLRCGYLVDFLVDSRSPSLLVLLLDKAIEYLRHEHTAIIFCLAVTPFYRYSFYRQGFFPWRWKRGYFSPRVDLTDPDLQVFVDLRQWYLTMGDGDLEMSS
jgi:hypothetical protein